jgi:hypothetical protein
MASELPQPLFLYDASRSSTMCQTQMRVPMPHECSATSNEAVLQIGLSAWIIQDGNYGDFATGTSTRFALEFYFEDRYEMCSAKPRLIHQHDGKYEATGIVTFVADDVWVVDFAGVLAFREEAPNGIARGDIVSGVIGVGVDPFFYFERLGRYPGIPAIIYSWQIEGIEMETAPFIETSSPFGRALARDQSKLRRVPIPKTDAWNDDGGHGEYLLACRRLPVPPTLSLRE